MEKEMKSLAALPMGLKHIFWSLVYACLIIYTAKILWDMIAVLKSLLNPADRKIRKAMQIEHGPYQWK